MSHGLSTLKRKRKTSKSKAVKRKEMEMDNLEVLKVLKKYEAMLQTKIFIKKILLNKCC